MSYERKDGDAVLYKERDKRNDKAPDWTGTVLIEGVEYRLAMWQKSGTMLAGVAKIVDRQQSRQAQQQGFQRGGSDRGGFGGRSAGSFSGRDRDQTRGFNANLDDDVPFVSSASVW